MRTLTSATEPLSCGFSNAATRQARLSPEKPLPIRGETWYEHRPPALLRFRTGHAAEQLLVFPAFAVAAVLLMPGAADLLTELMHALTEGHRHG